jgi:hypothetical protein
MSVWAETGILLSDLTVINERYPTFVGHGNLVNVSKLR